MLLEALFLVLGNWHDDEFNQRLKTLNESYVQILGVFSVDKLPQGW